MNLFPDDFMEEFSREEESARSEYDKLNIKKIIREAFSDAGENLDSKVQEKLDERMRDIETTSFYINRDKEMRKFFSELEEDFNTDNAYKKLLKESTNDKDNELNGDLFVENFKKYIDSEGSFNRRLELLKNLKLILEREMVSHNLFCFIHDLEKQNIEKKRGSKKKRELKKSFSDFIKDEYHNFLPDIRSSYMQSKPKNKVLMLFAMNDLKMLKYNFLKYSNRTEFHKAVVKFFEDQKEVGVRNGFWETADRLRDLNDYKTISDKEFHKQQILKITTP